MFQGKRILITGGTGSFGQAFTAALLERHPGVAEVIVFSRDEHKQFEMSQRFPYPKLRFILGDIRDAERVEWAFRGVDYIVHAAAQKHVPLAEFNPMECIKTNIIGAENIIKAALNTGVERILALSSEKAAAPINLYGATKLCADKLFVAANHMSSQRQPLRCSVVRYGNIIGSRGSVAPFFRGRQASGKLPITDPAMTRFNISPDEGVDFVFKALENAWGGEIFVPRIPSFRIIDLAEAVCPSCEQEIIGTRPGEKLHEEMITETEAAHTLAFPDHFVITPAIGTWTQAGYQAEKGGESLPAGFKYVSNNNDRWLSVAELREQVNRYVQED